METMSKGSPASFNCNTLFDSSPAPAPTKAPSINNPPPIQNPIRPPTNPPPIQNPTKSPTQAPYNPPSSPIESTSTSTESPTSCTDEDNGVFYINKKLKYKGCDWLKKNKNNKIKRYCNRYKDAKYYC